MAALRRLIFAVSWGFLLQRLHGETSGERNNWAVLVSTSKYWYNYRHTANTLSFYHTVKRLGIPDSQILVMLAEDIACNSRNPRPGTVFNDHRRMLNLYGEDVEVDYRGDEVSVDNFIRLITGRHPASTPRNKRLLTDSMSNIFLFITGHSGDEFIKFQDWEEITSNDIADAFAQMHKQRRYANIFWVTDTCQASTLQSQFYSPNIVAYGSSSKKESSFSHHSDPYLGVPVIDRFTYSALEFMSRITPRSKETLAAFTKWFDPNALHATPQLRSDLFNRKPEEVLLTEFFASTGRIRFQRRLMQLESATGRSKEALLLARRTAIDSSPARGGDVRREQAEIDFWGEVVVPIRELLSPVMACLLFETHTPLPAVRPRKMQSFQSSSLGENFRLESVLHVAMWLGFFVLLGATAASQF